MFSPSYNTLHKIFLVKCSSYITLKSSFALVEDLNAIIVCLLPFSPAGSVWAQWGLRAPGWPQLGISSPTALPPLADPQSKAPEADMQMQGSAGYCSCRLQMSCCPPPEEKPIQKDVNTMGRITDDKEWSVLLLTLPLCHTVSFPSGSISSVCRVM